MRKLTADDEAFVAGMMVTPTAALPRLVYADWLDEQGLAAEAEAWRFLSAHGIVGGWCDDYDDLFRDDGLVAGEGVRYNAGEVNTGYWAPPVDPDDRINRSDRVVAREWIRASLHVAAESTDWGLPGFPAPRSPGDMFHPVRHAQMLAAAYADAASAERAAWRRGTLVVCLRLRCAELNKAGEAYLVRLFLLGGEQVAGAVAVSGDLDPAKFVTVDRWDWDLEGPTGEGPLVVPLDRLAAFEVVLHEPGEVADVAVADGE